MPNHVGILILCGGSVDHDRDDWPPLDEMPDDLCDAVDPMPDEVKGDVPGLNPPWLVWATEHWGTKWGAYKTSAHEVGGDMRSVVIETQCAWRPPNRQCRDKIESFLTERWGFARFLWVTFDPYDDSLHALPDA